MYAPSDGLGVDDRGNPASMPASPFGTRRVKFGFENGIHRSKGTRLSHDLSTRARAHTHYSTCTSMQPQKLEHTFIFLGSRMDVLAEDIVKVAHNVKVGVLT